MDRDELIERVVDQIRKDLEDGDVTALEEMLVKLPVEYLQGFLPEEV